MKIFLLISFLFFFSKNVYSQDLFNSSFYEIEFKSNNIEDNKINKINELKKNSLIAIFNRTLENEKFVEVTSYLSDDLINTFIKNIVINNEKIIDDKYFSKVKINFDKKKIIKFFREKNIPYIEYYPEKFLLVIYENGLLNNNLFTKNNSYYNYYINNLKSSNFFVIPNLDINDRFILSKNDIVNRELNKIKNFSNKYDLNETIIVIANINNDKIIYDLILFSDGNLIEKKLELDVYQLDTFYQILEIEILNIWKKLNQIQNNTINVINCNVNYFNLLELKEIRSKLNKVSIIKNLYIKSLSYKKIEYDIHYYGNLKILSKIFKLNKLKLNYFEQSCTISLK